MKFFIVLLFFIAQLQLRESTVVYDLLKWGIEPLMDKIKLQYFNTSDKIKMPSFVEEYLESLGDNNDFKSIQPSMEYLHYFFHKIFECELSKSSCLWDDKKNYPNIFNSSSYYRQTLSSIETKIRGINGNLFTAALNFVEMKRTFSCPKDTESLRMKVNELYKFFIFIMMENYSIITYVYLKKSEPELRNPAIQKEIQELLAKIKNDSFSINAMAVEASTQALGDIQRCDLRHHIEHKTYERISPFTRGWVRKDDFLNFMNTCRNRGCSFQGTTFHEPTTSRNQKNSPIVLKLFKFPGNAFYGCSFAPILNTISTKIQSAKPEGHLHNIAFEDQVFEVVNNGQSTPSYQLNVFNYNELRDSLRKSKDGTTDLCKVCLCYNDRKSESDTVRRISTASVFVPPGSVVTGVRWGVKNQVIHLELRGHKLLDDGHIGNQSSGQWFDAFSSIDYTDDDYAYLDPNQRSMCLEDIVLPENMFIVGARFVLINKMICLSLQGVEGLKKKTLKNQWYERHPDELRTRSELVLDYSQTVRDWGADNEPQVSMTGKHFISFQTIDGPVNHTERVSVPYLDIQDVITEPPTPLQGIGTYYKGLKGSHGYLRLRIFTANLVSRHHLENTFETIDIFLPNRTLIC